MDLVRTSALTAVWTFIRLVAAFAVNKVVAVVAGPAGLALIGQVQNVGSIMQGLSSGLFGTAVVKYSAEWKDDAERRDRFLSLTFSLGLYLTLAVAGLVGVLSHWLAARLLNDAGYWWVFFLLGLTAPLFLVNSLMLSFLNGIGAIKELTLINIAQSMFGLLLSIALPLAFGLNGALAAAALSSTVVFGLIVRRFWRIGWATVRQIDFLAEQDNLKRIAGFALVAMTTSICAPASQLVVREWVLERCSPQEAGYWQCLIRFSGAYLVFFTTTMSVYYLPRFAETGVREVWAELRRVVVVVWPLAAALFFGIWLARAPLMQLLFAPEFLPAGKILHWQLIGDFLKLNSWLLGTLLLARGAVAWVVVSELIAATAYVASAIWFVGHDGSGGADGAAKASVLLYSFHLAIMLYAARSILRKTAH